MALPLRLMLIVKNGINSGSMFYSSRVALPPTFQFAHLPDELNEDQGELFLTAYENIKNRGSYTEYRALDDALLIYESLANIGFNTH